MKMINLIIAGLLVLISCDNPTKGNSSATDTAAVKDTRDIKETKDNKGMQQITWKEFSSGKECSIEKQTTIVITSQQQLDSLWSKAFKGKWQPEKRAVDFSKSSVIAIFLGTVNTGGHSAVITSINTNTSSDGYIVEAQHKLPGKSCISSMSIEFPYYMAVTDVVISGKTAFTISKKEVECE